MFHYTAAPFLKDLNKIHLFFRLAQIELIMFWIFFKKLGVYTSRSFRVEIRGS